MLESPRRNTTRRKARRMGAWSMILIGASGFWLMFEVGRAGPPIRVALAMILVTVALLTMLMCAMVDVYLTMRLRQSNRGPKMIRARRLKFSIVCLATLLTGCEADTTATTQPADAPTIDVVLAGRQFKLEVADEEKEREVGLMHRKSMPVDHGMLFAFPDLKPRTFWMKNTLLPLDIAFLRRERPGAERGADGTQRSHQCAQPRPGEVRDRAEPGRRRADRPQIRRRRDAADAQRTMTPLSCDDRRHDGHAAADNGRTISVEIFASGMARRRFESYFSPAEPSASCSPAVAAHVRSFGADA